MLVDPTVDLCEKNSLKCHRQNMRIDPLCVQFYTDFIFKSHSNKIFAVNLSVFLLDNPFITCLFVGKQFTSEAVLKGLGYPNTFILPTNAADASVTSAEQLELNDNSSS